MHHDTTSVSAHAFALMHFHLPEPVFRPAETPHESLRPAWTALGERRGKIAVRLAHEALKTLSGEAVAACLCTTAAGELMNGSPEKALRAAEEARLLLPGHWITIRLLESALRRLGAYGKAYDLLAAATGPYPAFAWDDPLSPSDHRLGMASLALRTGNIRGAADHLMEAFADHIDRVPEELLTDWFRFSLNLDRPEESALAAERLIRSLPPEAADPVIQAVLQRGWTEQAYRLYRTAFSRHPTDSLIRRRLVGLSIRVGQVEDARLLLKPYPLEIAA